MSEYQSIISHETDMPASVCMHVCTCVSACDHVQSLLFARWLSLSLSLPAAIFCIAWHCVVVVFTVGTGFVDKIAEVEQGGPGSQVLNEPLRKRRKITTHSYNGQWRKDINNLNKLFNLTPVIGAFFCTFSIIQQHIQFLWRIVVKTFINLWHAKLNCTHIRLVCPGLNH